MTDDDRMIALCWARTFMLAQDKHCRCGRCAAARVIVELLDDTPVTGNDVAKEFLEEYWQHGNGIGWVGIGAVQIKTRGQMNMAKQMLELQEVGK